ncbi:MAG TPA: 16S rRNA (cytidine(1402)-2'-O)-methyltransferase [Xanthomonadales bacterium]|nr:16S rRNA (cytidine(1402)-2'-O)-methyltransferase [Xanthomonadales bacterium]
MTHPGSSGRLYVVATPIGNLDDITLRALRVLAEADVVAAEDTRHSRTLLSRHGLERPLLALHEHNEEQQAALLVERLKRGESVALISDAGTPLLSDPGYRLVGLAAAEGIEVVAIPGASAVTAALSISGLATDRFAFEGFLPARSSARRQLLQDLQPERRTLVFFESSHRIADSLAEMALVFGPQRQAALCRELTKRFETVLRGPLGDISERVGADPDQRRGEFVLVVAGCPKQTEEAFPEAVRLARELQPLLGASQAARTAARFMGVPRRAVYEALSGPEAEAGSE